MAFFCIGGLENAFFCIGGNSFCIGGVKKFCRGGGEFWHFCIRGVKFWQLLMVYDLFIDCFPYWHRRGGRVVLHPGSRFILALNPVTGWGFSPKIPIPALLGSKNPVPPPKSRQKKYDTPPKVDVKKIDPHPPYKTHNESKAFIHIKENYVFLITYSI